MYTGFSLNNISFDEYNVTKNWDALFSGHKQKTYLYLYKYITQDGIINGDKIQEDWFPEIKADIFISHSHDDADSALHLARLLYDRFNLVSFIDSFVWGYANDLLREIDNKYCKTNKDLYDYNKRNYSTSHVHMMLMTALNKMIDKTECIFFLNTENSIVLNDIENSTLSPWIYGEIEITRTIQKKSPEETRECIKLAEGGKLYEEFGLKIRYPLNIAHLNQLDVNKFSQWYKCGRKGPYALDELYRITELIE